MTSRGQQAIALFFSVLLISSVIAGSIAVSGGLAAAEPGDTEPNNAGSVETESFDIVADSVLPSSQYQSENSGSNTRTKDGTGEEASGSDETTTTQATRCEQAQRGGDRSGDAYLGSESPSNCDVLEGASSEGNLRVFVADGLINVQRYNEGWVNQYYTYGGAVVYVGGEKVSLGYYTSNRTGPSGGWGAINRYAEPVSQSKSGSTITTTWMVDGLRIEQEVIYQSGDQYYSLNWDITNTDDNPQSDVRFLRGADTYLANGDFGNGFWDDQTNSIGVRKTVQGSEQRLFFRGITDPDGYRSAFYSDVVSDVESADLENQARTENHDNGYALEWRDETLGPGEELTIQAIESFARSRITVQSDESVTLTNGTAELSYTVENTGTQAQEIEYSVSGPELFNYTTPATDTLPAGATEQVTVPVNPPSGYPAGEYSISLVANGSDTQPTQAVAQLEIPSENRSANLPPTAEFDTRSETPTADQPVELSASSSRDPNGDQLTYEWDFGQTGSVDATGEVVRKNFTTGSRRVALTVSDGQLSDTVVRSITVESGESVPTAAFTIENDTRELSQPIQVTVGSQLTFDASGSTAPSGRQITAYSWSFDNGRTASGETVRRTFDSEGEYSVQLTVTDSDGKTQSIQKQVSVSGAPPAPEINEISQPGDGIIPQSPTLNDFGNTWRVDVSSENEIDRVEFRFPGAGQFTDNNGADGWTAQPDINDLNDGVVVVTAYDTTGQATSTSTTIDTFDLPTWAEPYRTKLTTDDGLVVKGGVPRVGPPPISFGVLAANAEVVANAETSLTHPVGTRNAEGGGEGDLEVSIKPAVGPGVGGSAGIEADGVARVGDERLRWQRATITGSAGNTVYAVLLNPNILGNEIEIEGSLGYENELTAELDTVDQIEVDGGSYRTAIVIVPASAGASVGAGVVLASVEVGGEVTFDGTVGIDEDTVSGTLGAAGKVYVSGNVGIFYFDKAYGPEGDIQVSTSRGSSADRQLAIAPENDSGYEWKLMGKYSNETGQMANTATVSSTANDSNEGNVTVLTADNLADREPAIDSIKSETTAVWSAQDPNKSVTNGTDIVVNTRSDGQWNTTVSLTDDDRYETYPAIESKPGGNGLVWARANESISANNVSEPIDLLEHYDIVTARQDGSTLGNLNNVTNNSIPEFEPVITGNDEAWVVGWNQDTDRNLSTTSDRRVKYAVLNKDMTDIRQRGTVRNATEVVAGQGDGQLTIATRSPTGVSRLEFESDGTLVRQERRSVQNVTGVAVNGETVAWVNSTSDGPAVYTATRGEVTTLPNVPMGVTNIQLLNKTGSQVLAYKAQPTNKNATVYYHFRNGTSQTWTGPRQVETADVPIRTTDFATTNGSINAVIASTPSVQTRADIVTVQQEYADKDVAVDAETTETTPTSATVEATISNQGDNESNPSTLSFQTPSGTVLTKPVPSLLPGERVVREFNVTSPVAGNGTLQLDGSANPADTNDSNDVDSIEFATDLTVSSVKDQLTNDGENVTIVATVGNNGPLPAQNATLVAQSSEQTVSATASAIDVNGTWTVPIELDADLNTSSSATVVVNPNGTIPETVQENNEREAKIRQPDVGLVDGISYAPSSSAQNGRQARLFLTSGDSGEPTTNVTANVGNQSVNYLVPLPAARSENDSVFVPAVLSVPSPDSNATSDANDAVGSSSSDETRVQFTASPTDGLDTDLSDNAVIDGIPADTSSSSTVSTSEVEREQAYPELDIANATESGGDRNTVTLRLTNPNNVVVGEIITLKKSGTVLNRTAVAVTPDGERQIQIPVNVTGTVEIQSAGETTTVSVTSSDDTVGDGGGDGGDTGGGTDGGDGGGGDGGDGGDTDGGDRDDGGVTTGSPGDDADTPDSTEDTAQDFPTVQTEPTVVEEVGVENQAAVFSETEVVSRVVFDESTPRSVAVAEFTGMSSSRGDAIVERIVSNDTEIDNASTLDLITLADISPNGSLAGKNTSATVVMNVSADEIDDSERAVIFHRTDDGWERRPTSVSTVSNGTVTLTTSVDSFSLFAVGEESPPEDSSTSSSTEDETGSDDSSSSESESSTDDTTEEVDSPERDNAAEPTEEQGGVDTTAIIGVIGALAVILTTLTLLRRRRDK